MPTEPVIWLASSERMSPKRFSVTITSNWLGSRIICMDALSTYMWRSSTSGYSSATALIRDTTRTMAAHPESLLHAIAAEQSGVDGRTAFLAKERGDEAGAQGVEDYIEHLTCGRTNLVNIFFPEVLALSGGVANQGDALLLPLRERVRERSFGSRYAVSHTRIERCTLGYRAGVIGAAMLARE